MRTSLVTPTRLSDDLRGAGLACRGAAPGWEATRALTNMQTKTTDPYHHMKTQLSLLSLLIAFGCGAQSLEPALQAKLDVRLKVIQTWAEAPVIVSAVKAHNASPSAEAAAMTQEKWKAASVMDPFIRSFTKNTAAEFLKGKRDKSTSEAFLSGADGTKVAFLAKTTSWSHKGKPKHDVPMSGKPWQGQVEVDESTGQQQVQISVPVLDGDKPIGSLVVGFSVSKLESE
jgi:hypothetical protein